MIHKKVMVHFRATPEQFERWSAIRLPFGDNDLSSVIRHALNQLYLALVTGNHKPGGFNVTLKTECKDCKTMALVNDECRCLVCYEKAKPPGNVHVGGAAPDQARSTERKPRGTSRPTDLTTPREDDPHKRSFSDMNNTSIRDWAKKNGLSEAWAKAIIKRLNKEFPQREDNRKRPLASCPPANGKKKKPAKAKGKQFAKPAKAKQGHQARKEGE